MVFKYGHSFQTLAFQGRDLNMFFESCYNINLLWVLQVKILFKKTGLLNLTSHLKFPKWKNIL